MRTAIFCLLAGSAWAAGVPAGDWTAHGFTPAQRQELLELLRDSARRQEVSGGAFLLIHKGEAIFREAFGYADLETRRPFRAEDPCFIASLTKAITATMMVMLDERGALSLDDPVGKWIPSFKGARVRGAGEPAPPLVWQLLSHRSGLPGNSDPGAAKMPSGTKSRLDAMIEGWVKDGLMAAPGTRFAYGNAGYLAASRAAERATGKDYEELLKTMLLEPLGMRHTTYRPSAEDMKRAPRRYNRTPKGLVKDTRVFPMPVEGGFVNAAGGLFSTLDDLGRFLLFHLNGGAWDGRQLVSKKALARMYRPHPPVTGPKDVAYGLGFNVGGNPRIRHLGASGTLMWLDFEHDSAGVLLTQVPWGNRKQLIGRLTGKIASFYSK